MKTYTSVATVLTAALSTFLLISIVMSRSAKANSVIKTSGNVGTLESRGDIVFDPPVSASVVKTSGESAVTIAEQRLDLNDSELDRTVGAVHALVSIKGSPIHQKENMWVVPFNDDIRGPGNGILYHKLYAAVSAITGKMEYAFTVQPDVARSLPASAKR